MNFDAKVVVVNSEISSRVTQPAGIRLSRYGSGDVSGKKGSLRVEIFLRKCSTQRNSFTDFPQHAQFSTFFVSLVEANELHNSAGFKLIWSMNG